MRMSFKDDMDDFTNSPLDDMVEGEAEGQLRTQNEKNVQPGIRLCRGTTKN